MYSWFTINCVSDKSLGYVPVYWRIRRLQWPTGCHHMRPTLILELTLHSRYVAIYFIQRTQERHPHTPDQNVYHARTHFREERGDFEVYGSCSDTSLERLQVIQNKLLKLLLRLDPYTSTNLLHSELNILKVKDLYNTSLLLFVHANLQGDCRAAVKNYFVRRNIVYNKRQTGHLEYRRARLDLGTSRVQYHAAELWNLLSDVIKNIPCRKYFKRNLCEKLVQWYSEQFLQGRCH